MVFIGGPTEVPRNMELERMVVLLKMQPNERVELIDAMEIEKKNVDELVKIARHHYAKADSFKRRYHQIQEGITALEKETPSNFLDGVKRFWKQFGSNILSSAVSEREVFLDQQHKIWKNISLVLHHLIIKKGKEEDKEYHSNWIQALNAIFISRLQNNGGAIIEDLPRLVELTVRDGEEDLHTLVERAVSIEKQLSERRIDLKSIVEQKFSDPDLFFKELDKVLIASYGLPNEKIDQVLENLISNLKNINDPPGFTGGLFHAFPIYLAKDHQTNSEFITSLLEKLCDPHTLLKVESNGYSIK